MSTSNRSPAGRSEITLTPGLDGLSDYQQYLEKTSRKGSFLHSKPPGESSRVNSPVPTDDTEALQQSSKGIPDSPVVAPDNQHELRASPTFEEIKPAGRRKTRKRRPHRVEQEEDPNDYLSPLPLALLTLGICLSVFLVSLDRTIVATVSGFPSTRTQSIMLTWVLQRPYHELRMTSTPTTMSAGTAARTS